MSEGYRTVRRIAAVLNLLTRSSEPLRLSEIAKTLDIPLSSAHLLLGELMKEGLVRQVDDRQYVPGAELISLGAMVISRLDVLNAARTVMNQLANETRQDVYLAVPSQSGMVYVERVLGPLSLRLEIPLGIPRPLHSTSVGQLFLSQIDRKRSEELMSELTMTTFTPFTIVDRDQLRKRIEETRERGYSLTDQENVEGIVAFSAPIFDFRNQMVGALSLSVFRTHAREFQDELIQGLLAGCFEVSVHLGHKSTGSSSVVEMAVSRTGGGNKRRKNLGANAEGTL